MIILKDSLLVCSHCRRDFKIRVSDDVGFKFHWVGDEYLIDVVLLLEDFPKAILMLRYVYGF